MWFIPSRFASTTRSGTSGGNIVNRIQHSLVGRNSPILPTSTNTFSTIIAKSAQPLAQRRQSLSPFVRTMSASSSSDPKTASSSSSSKNSSRSHPTGAVIFLHGSGGGGREFYQTFTRYCADMPHIKWICPEAQARPYSLLEGQSIPVWFDRTTLDLDCPEDPPGIARSVALVEGLVANEVASGIPKSRILIAGFSQGGSLSYYVTFGRTNKEPYAACITCSSFLPDPSRLFASDEDGKEPTSIPKHLHSTPLRMVHGIEDMMVPFDPHSKSTFGRLSKVIPNSQHVPLERLDHRVDLRVLRLVKGWLKEFLPPV